jgi:hypothetical protein
MPESVRQTIEVALHEYEYTLNAPGNDNDADQKTAADVRIALAWLSQQHPEPLDAPDGDGYFTFEGRIDGSSVERLNWLVMVRRNLIEDELYAYRFGGQTHKARQMIGKWTRVYMPWEDAQQQSKAMESRWKPVENNTFVQGKVSPKGEGIVCRRFQDMTEISTTEYDIDCGNDQWVQLVVFLPGKYWLYEKIEEGEDGPH